jgi:hypothetical protein
MFILYCQPSVSNHDQENGTLRKRFLKLGPEIPTRLNVININKDVLPTKAAYQVIMNTLGTVCRISTPI